MLRLLPRQSAAAAIFAIGSGARAALAQSEHAHHQTSEPRPAPTLPGQDAFGAIAEVVRLLEADATTDWSKVDVERLRQHLIDMNAFTLRARVSAVPLPAGARFTITGDSRTMTAAHAMFDAHIRQLGEVSRYRAMIADGAGSLQVAVTARDPADVAAITRIRALGAVGFLSLDDHHRAHHLALARGDIPAAHQHR